MLSAIYSLEKTYHAEFETYESNLPKIGMRSPGKLTYSWVIGFFGPNSSVIQEFNYSSTGFSNVQVNTNPDYTSNALCTVPAY